MADRLDIILLLFFKLLATAYVTADSTAGSNFFSVDSSLEDVSATVLLSIVGENLSPSDKKLVSSSRRSWSVRLTTALDMTLVLGITVGVLCLNNPENVG